MAFIRKKKFSDYRGSWIIHYLVENHRIDGKVTQKVLAYLGYASTPEAALWNALNDLQSQLFWENNLTAKQKTGSFTMSDGLDLDRAKRKIGRILARVELLEQYASAPVPEEKWKTWDDDVQRTWKNLKIAREEANRPDFPVAMIAGEIDPHLMSLIRHLWTCKALLALGARLPPLGLTPRGFRRDDIGETHAPTTGPRHPKSERND